MNLDDLLALKNYIKPVHHIKGRLRLRIDPKVKKEVEGISLQDIKELPKHVEGLTEVRVNKLAGTVIIRYNHEVFPYELWENLLQSQDIESIKELLSSLQRSRNEL